MSISYSYSKIRYRRHAQAYGSRGDRGCFRNGLIKKIIIIDPKTLTELSSQVVLLATEVALFIESQLHKVTQNDIEEKDLNSLVSYVDKEAEIRLVKTLSRLRPEASFITEEETVASKKVDEIWIIDPLDGTNNFLHKIPHFAISIALQVQGEVVLGVVYDVTKKECFHAIKGGGAYLNIQSISVSKTHKIPEAFLATGFPYSNTYDELPIMNTLVHWLKNARGVRRMGAAALDLAYVACGRFDAYYETTLNIWDVAAGNLLVEEAGGKVTDYSGGDHHKIGDQILASNGHLHDMVKEVLNHQYALASI